MSAIVAPSRWSELTAESASGEPARVAIVGAGPAGLYSADALVTSLGAAVRVDLFERWPTPFGLLRFGVAPDAFSIKQTARWFERVLGHPSVRYFGHVRVGHDLTVEELKQHYHQVLLTTGCPHTRRLELPGQDFGRCLDAANVFRWYNSDPDHASLAIDWRTVERLVVVGMGNTALDVARVLLSPPDELTRTDISPAALTALRQSRLRRVELLARRGPAEVTCDPREIERLVSLPGVGVEVDAPDLTPDRARSAEARKTVEYLAALARRTPRDAARTVSLRFQSAPVEFVSNGDGSALRIERRAPSDNGAWRSTGQAELVPADALLRAVGFRGEPLPGVPFDSDQGTIPNQQGCVGDRLYVAGWIKRGAIGLLGTTKADARETAERMLAELPRDRTSGTLSTAELEHVLGARGVRPVGLDGWRKLDRFEIERGKALGKPRQKLASVTEMLAALKHEP